MKEYYKLLQLSAKEHYINLHKIDKLRETDELSSIQMEKNIKTNYNFELNNLYQKALNSGDWVVADKLRDKVFESMDGLYKLNQQETKLIEDTGYKKREYEALKTGDSNLYDKTMLDILIEKSKKFKEGKIEWYDSQISILEKQKGIADKIKEIADTITNEFNGIKIKIISNFKNLVSYDKGSNFISSMKNYNPKNTLASDYLNKFSELYKDKLLLQNGTFLDKYKTMTQSFKLVTIKDNMNDTFNVPLNIRLSEGGNKSIRTPFSGLDMTTKTGQNMAIIESWVRNKPLTGEMFNNVLNENYDAFINGMLTESQKITATDLGFKTNKSKFRAIFQGMDIVIENIWNTIDDAISNVTLSINQLTQNAENKSRSLQNLYNKDNLFSTVNKLQDDIINNILQRIIFIKDEINKEISGDKNAQYLLDLNSELVNLESESGNIVKQMADQMKEWISNGIATKNWETNSMWDLPLDELNKKFQEIAMEIKLFEMSTGILEISKDSKKEDISTVINNILNMGKFQPSMATGISALEDVKATYKIFKDLMKRFTNLKKLHC